MNTTDTPTTRPLAERITQGTAVFDIEAVHASKPGCFLITDGTQDPLNGIAVACIHKEHGERIANAELIAEAFNVTHETGRTPRQLADERAELITALNGMLDWARRVNTLNPGPEVVNACNALNRLNP
jgi:hypothetical protein